MLYRCVRAVWSGPWIVGESPIEQASRWRRRVRELYLSELALKGSRLRDRSTNSGVSVTVVVPVGPNDTATFVYSLASIDRHLDEHVERTIVVHPASSRAEIQRRAPDIESLDDEMFLPDDVDEELAAAGIEQGRWGWYRQQIVKLLCVLAQETPFVYVLDADTVLVRRQRFTTNGGQFVLVSQEYHAPYFDQMSRLFGEQFRRPVYSTTAHQMMYSKDQLAKCCAEIEGRFGGLPWWKAVIRNVDSAQTSGFAESELYGQWILAQSRYDVRLFPFLNTSVRRSDIVGISLDKVYERFGFAYDSVSFHYYHRSDNGGGSRS